MILPDSIVTCANQALDTLRKQGGKNICPDMDGAQLLTQRATLMQLKSPTQVSANGSCYLLMTGDKQWIALNLSRDADWELLPALFQSPEKVSDITQVKTLAKNSPAATLVAQGRTLGLAIAMATMQNTTLKKNKDWFGITCRGDKKLSRSDTPLVVDLSSLWAGPLCSQLLQQTGARVIKVESKQRPDGARLHSNPGAKEFFHHLNQNKTLMELDFKNPGDIEKLKKLVASADIVIEGSRPRALQQLGIDAETIVKQQSGLVWISITGYGRREPQANWIAFGDDAAVSAGLFNTIDNKPVFIGDAIADPLTGLHAALAALRFYQQGQSVLLDINLHRVANHCATNGASQFFN